MDYDAGNKRKPLGPDGCLLFDSPMNVGLGSIWCDSCPLKQLYDEKYSDLSRADFWVAAGNAVIFLTSVNNSLDLRNTFYWGRTTLDSCPGSDSRLPTTSGCQDVEGVFLERMGLTWKVSSSIGLSKQLFIFSYSDNILPLSPSKSFKGCCRSIGGSYTGSWS